MYKDISEYVPGSMVVTPSGVLFVVVSQQKGLTKVQRIDNKDILVTQKISVKLR